MAKRYIAGGITAAAVTLLVMGTLSVPSVMADTDVVAPPVVNVSGTDWVQVSTPGELEYIDENQNEYLTDNIELMNSIDLTGYAWSSFGESTAFTGVFNGNGHEVTNVSVSGSYNYAGFFGLSNGVVENIGVKGTFSSSVSTNVGGLVGYQDGGTISDSYATGSVIGGYGGNGGLVGEQDGGTISDSYATGSVSGSNSFNGGLVGVKDNGTISDSYATGSVSGSNSFNGGLVGYQNGGSISDSYFDSDTTGMSSGVGQSGPPILSSADVTAESTLNMKTPSTFSGWSTSDWTLFNGYYPLLNWQIIKMSVSPTDVVPGGQVTVTGSVYSPGGTPLSDATVNLTGTSGTGPWAQSTVTTDTSGDFTGYLTAPNTTEDATVTATATVSGTTVQQQSTIHVQAYTVSFNSNGGSTVPSETLAYDGAATKPTDPTKTGYTFAGWYSDSALTAPYDFSAPVTGNETLYAQWIANSTAAPSGLGHSNVTQTGWTETWAPVSNAFSYDVYLNGNPVGSTTQSVYSYTFTGEQPGTTYQVGVSSVNGSNQPSGEATDSVTTAVYRGPIPPDIIQDFFPEPAQVGQNYSATVHETGGTDPMTWAVTSGQLPPGLSLDNQGNITGTPTTAGTFTFTVNVTDANHLSATRQLTLTVDSSPTPTITTSNVTPGNVNQSYSESLTATGGTVPYKWSIASGTLPTGLSLNADTGMLEGTPTASSLSPITVEVTDANGKTATQAMTVDILQPYERAVVWNGKVQNVPAVVGNDGGTQTTYMPIWYVMQLLKPMGIESTWNGQAWQMTSSGDVDLTNVQAGTGSTSIYLNGTLVQNVNTVAQNDPSTGKPTTYMPIWYVEQILERVGLTSTWNGTTWTVTQTNS